MQESLKKKNGSFSKVEETNNFLTQIPFLERKFIQSFPFPIYYSKKLGKSLSVDPFVGTGFFIKHGHITRLQIQNHPKLKNTSEKIGSLSHLEALIIENSGIKELPSSITLLSRLKFLSLQFNLLTEIPQNFGDLQDLRYLSIAEDGIISLPKSFEELQELKILGLSGSFSSFPKLISTLSNLEELSFLGSNIQNLPSDLGNLTFLRVLNLSNNTLSSLPASIASIRSLNSLDLQFNQISLLSSILALLPHLDELKLAHNPLISLSGIPKHLYHHFRTHINWEALPPAAQQFFHANDDDALFAFYSISPMELAQRFVKQADSLSQDEYYRLISEATANERAYLDLHLPANSSILYEIDQYFLKHSTNNLMILF